VKVEKIYVADSFTEEQIQIFRDAHPEAEIIKWPLVEGHYFFVTNQTTI
jgi:hypothetical protein